MATQTVKIYGYNPITNAVLNTVTFVNGGTYTDSTDYVNITGDMIYQSNQLSYNPATVGSSIQESIGTFPVSIIVEKSTIEVIYQGTPSGYTPLG